MPASRRARAMILAPRSWPSKPGLATTTRILRAVAASIRPGTLAGAQSPWGRHPAAGGDSRGAEAGDGRQQGHGERDQAATEALETERLPTLLAGERRRARVGVDGDRVTDRAQHRQVGERVGVGVGGGELDPVPVGEFLHRRDLALAVDERPVEATGVVPLRIDFVTGADA